MRKIPGKTWRRRHGSLIGLLPEHLGNKKNVVVVDLGPGLQFRPSALVHPGGDIESFRGIRGVRRFVSEIADSAGRRLPLSQSAFTTHEPIEIYDALSKGGVNVEVHAIDSLPMDTVIRREAGPRRITCSQQDFSSIRLEKPVDVLFGLNIMVGGEKPHNRIIDVIRKNNVIRKNRLRLKGSLIVSNPLEPRIEEELGLRRVGARGEGVIYRLNA
jgi:hypothetical protein